MMPLMDGRSFRQAQLQSPELASIPVVVISAFRDVAQTLQEMKVVDLLKKPFRLQELVGLARRYCGASPEAC
jgi:FixJ family two-component response regulator